MNTELVLFKNSPERLLIILDEKADFSELLECINSKVQSNRDFFKGASLRLKYKGRELNRTQEEYIARAFKDIGEVDVIDIGTEIEIPPNGAGNNFRGIAYGLYENIQQLKNPIKKTKSMEQISEGLSVYYKGDLNNGQRIVYKGSVFVIGNVKKGAEIIASENIIVFGTISGSVHAGGKNLKTAAILCEILKTDDFSIAGIKRKDEKFIENLKRAGKGGLFSKKRVEMKILSLVNNSIHIDTLSDL